MKLYAQQTFLTNIPTGQWYVSTHCETDNPPGQPLYLHHDLGLRLKAINDFGEFTGYFQTEEAAKRAIEKFHGW